MIGILTTAYKRPQISKSFCLMIDRIMKDYPGKFLPMCIASLEEDRALFEAHNIETWIHENHPLAGKWNLGLSKLAGRVDHIIVIDSDDIINNNYIDQLLSNTGYDLVWCRGLYILCAEQNGFRGKVRFWDAPYKTFGATGMFINGSLLDKTGWRLYHGNEDNMMGYSSHNFLLPHITSEFKFNLRETSSVLLDIKSEGGIHGFSGYAGNGIGVDFDALVSMFSEREANYLRDLIETPRICPEKINHNETHCRKDPMQNMQKIN